MRYLRLSLGPSATGIMVRELFKEVSIELDMENTTLVQSPSGTI